MQIRMTGHAGLFIRARGATILCDPWFNTSYFGSWFPFPDNAGLDLAEISSPDYLYISHLHKDHFDARFLEQHVDKSTTVLLPDFPMREMQPGLEALGFTKFVQTRSGRRLQIEGGAKVAIATSVSVADGPIGDSAIAVDDGKNRILNQNDCHPRDLRSLMVLAPYDVHFLQYSGAIWYPMVYRMDAEEKSRLARQKRERQVKRALNYIEEVDAPHVVPFAGPPAFLDDDLFALNDLDDDPENIFLDQKSFLRALEGVPKRTGHLAVPGSEIELDGDRFELRHAMPAGEIKAAYEDKRVYLSAYAERRRSEIDQAVPEASVVMDPAVVIATLKAWFEPLMAAAPTVCQGLGGPIVIDVGRYGVVIDPATGEVRRWNETPSDHYFAFAESLLCSLVARHVDDWVNELFLSCRFEAWRSGPYNEMVFSFFKCLSPGRMAYFEASRAMSLQGPEGSLQPADLWRCGPYLVQRSCPHLGADLSRFSEVHNGILICALHGHRFELESGQCLDADCAPLFTHRVPDDENASVTAGTTEYL